MAIAVLLLVFLVMAGTLTMASSLFGWITWGGEVFYFSSADSLANNGRFLFAGAPNESTAPLYPLAIAPAFLLGDVDAAARAAKFLNAVYWSSVVLPVYLLARRLMAAGPAVLAAASAVLTGQVYYTGWFIAESIYFPLTYWLIYLTHGFLLHGGAGRALATGGAAAMVYFAKPSGLATIIACGIAIVIVFVANRYRGLPGHKMPSGKAIATALLTVAGSIALYASWRVSSGQPLLPYGAVFAEIVPTLLNFDVGKAMFWEAMFIGQVALMSGGALFALAVWQLARERASPFAVLSSCVIIAVVTVGAWFNGYLNGWVVERHVFVVLPLIAIWGIMGALTIRNTLGLWICVVLTLAGIGLMALAPEYEFFAHAATLLRADESTIRALIVGAIGALVAACAAAVVQSRHGLALVIGVLAFLVYNVVIVALPQYAHYADENGIARANRRPIVASLCGLIDRPANIVYVGRPELPMKDQIIKDYLYFCRDHQSVLAPLAFVPTRPSYVIVEHGLEPPGETGRTLVRLGSWGDVRLYRVAAQDGNR